MEHVNTFTQPVSKGRIQPGLVMTMAYHLFPGVLIAGFYLAVRPYLMRHGFPAMAAMLLAIFCVAIPVELSELIRCGYQRNGRLSLEGIVTFNRRMPARKIIGWTILFVIFAVVTSQLVSGIDIRISAYLHNWLPDWFFLNDPASFTGYSRNILMWTLIANLVLNGFLAPVVEELYFRGFLLPRLGSLKKWAPIINSLLFTIYHFWQPYAYFSIFVIFTPLFWLVWKKQSVNLSIAAHCTMNILGNLFLFAGIFH